MTAIDYELEYNNRLRIAEYPDIVARWRADSAATRRTARAALDQPYGPGERHRYDRFRADDVAAPLVVFLHGGYWQLGAREDVSFIAPALVAAGLDVAIPSYSLCPAVTVLDIIDDIRRCLVELWRATQRRPLVIGHSAGGHLAAAMLATDWARVAGAPPDLVRAAIALSGVFEMAPLIATTMNRALRLDPATAAEASPRFWPPPPRGATLIAAVGAEETGEFHRQSRAIAQAWGEAGVTTEYVSLGGVHHFTILDELTRPGVLLDRIVALAGR